MKRILGRSLRALFLLLAITFLPVISGKAAGTTGYKMHSMPKPLTTKYYKLVDNFAGGLAGGMSLFRNGKKVTDITYLSGNIIYSDKDFYFMGSVGGSHGFLKVDYSGKVRLDIEIEDQEGWQLLGFYKNKFYYSSYNYVNGDDALYQINVTSKKIKKICGKFSAYDSQTVTSGKYLFCRNTYFGGSKLVKINMDTGKVATVAASGVARVWKSQDAVYVTTNNYKEKQGNDLSKVKSTVKQFNTKTNKLKTISAIKKSLILYGNKDITVYMEKVENYQYLYLYLKGIKKTIKIKTTSYLGDPVIKGDYCYYAAFNSKQNKNSYTSTSEIWKVSMKTGKTKKVKSFKNVSLCFSETKAYYFKMNKDDTYKCVYVALN